KTAEISLPADLKSLQDLAAPTQDIVSVQFPRALHAPAGFPKPDPFTDAEMRAARQGLSAQLEILRAETRNRAGMETARQLELGNNPEVPVSGMVGEMRLTRERKIQAAAEIGYNEVVS